MKKMLFFACIILLLFCVGCSKEDTKLEDEIKVGIVGNDYPVDRATVAKMISLANFSRNEILALDDVINFDDVKEKDWYEKYINCAYIKGDMSGIDAKNFAPMDNLTVTQTQYLIDKYDESKKIKIDNTNKDKPVSYALWCDIYYQLMNEKDVEQIDFIILANEEINSELKNPYVMTDKGLYCFDGIDTTKYINKKIRALVKGQEVIAITEVLELEPTLKRCYIEKVGKDYLEIFLGGVTKKLYVKNMDIDLKQTNILADIKISEDEILGIEYYQETTRGKVNKIDENIIRLNNTNYVLDEDFVVYRKEDEKISYASKNDLIIGNDLATYFTKGNENKIYACIIDSPLVYDNVRVAIKTDNYQSLYFDEIKLKSNSGLDILVKGEKKQMQSLDIKKNQDFGIGENEIIIIEPTNKDEGIIFENLKRNYTLPLFYGKIEICKKDGKYIVINEISLEKYIASVLASSPMDLKETESLKALSIIYRTIAIQDINENSLYYLGANVDDSSQYQTYNNLKMEKNFEDIANETKGKILKSEGQIINPTYFLASGGVTANSGEVWPEKNYLNYPTENKPYLNHIKDFSEDIYGDLSEEINANIFFKTKDINCLEKDGKWFRWTTTLEESDIDKINENIKEIYKTEKYFIKTLENGKYIYKPVEDIGKIKDIKIRKRGEGGNIIELEIVGDKNTVLLINDTTIKKVFSINSVVDNNNQIVQNMKNLPSNFYVFDKIYDNNGNLKKLTFYGGGYGHCVGFSIYGAEKMAQNQSSYTDILNKYYQNIEILDIV